MLLSHAPCPCYQHTHTGRSHGCHSEPTRSSSDTRCHAENGPFHINDDLTLSENANGWDVGHNVIFVDQPIGTGFSYSDSPDDSVYDEHGVAADMLDFITEFLKAHPHLADNDFFVTGEVRRPFFELSLS